MDGNAHRMDDARILRTRASSIVVKLRPSSAIWRAFSQTATRGSWGLSTWIAGVIFWFGLDSRSFGTALMPPKIDLAEETEMEDQVRAGMVWGTHPVTAMQGLVKIKTLSTWPFSEKVTVSLRNSVYMVSGIVLPLIWAVHSIIFTSGYWMCGNKLQFRL